MFHHLSQTTHLGTKPKTAMGKDREPTTYLLGSAAFKNKGLMNEWLKKLSKGLQSKVKNIIEKFPKNASKQLPPLILGQVTKRTKTFTRINKLN